MIYRFDVRTAVSALDARSDDAGKEDSLGRAVRHQIAEFGLNVGPIATTRIFLIESETDASKIHHAARALLADPVIEQVEWIAQQSLADRPDTSRIEIHLKPGVMDPVAASTEMALRDLGVDVREVRTGRAFLIEGIVAKEELQQIAGKVLANGVIESVHFDRFLPAAFARGRDYDFKVTHVPMRGLSDDQLKKLSREGHLFLSLAEMRAIQNYFRTEQREPTDAELETLAQTWSEHCVHKTLKSSVGVIDESGKPLRTYKNLIKETIFDSTMTLMKQKPGFCLSVFKDNAGVIAFDETDAVCFKVETHNHPSAIEPYGGAATGAGGCIRDVLGTGLAAKPIANTDVFCVAEVGEGSGAGESDEATKRRSDEGEENPAIAAPETLLSSPPSSLRRSAAPSLLPKGIIHPKRVLQQVVAGVRDYGNRMGIPTVNGAVYFDDRYLGNPLVFCGCVGLIPRDKISKAARPGDAIVVMGGRTGRDGIHGATFSSAELTDTHADEFSHAVQIGNAITEKKVADVLLAARDRGLFTAVTDCGAGGLSSAVGEMGEKIGALVELDKVPLKYAGLRYDEIWISEAQERMVLSVPAEHLEELLALSAAEDVESTVIGTFGTPGEELILRYSGEEVGRIAMEFLHNGIPMPTRRAVVSRRENAARTTGVSPVSGVTKSKESSSEVGSQVLRGEHGRDARGTGKLLKELLSLLARPNIASKHWIIRQYDHEVQGGSVIKPLVGPAQIGPSDGAVIRPKLGSYKGVALGCGLTPSIADPYDMAIAAIDEAVRNVVAVGADPTCIAILDNFCWPSVDDEITMGTLVRACEACRDAALAYGIPFISGKDSLHNQFTIKETGEVIRIPSTLLISAIAVIEDVRRCITMDLKRAGNVVYLVSPKAGDVLKTLPAVHRTVSDEIRAGRVASCHDVSDGGILVAAAEMAIASGLGLELAPDLLDLDLFGESPGRYLIEVEAAWNPKLLAEGAEIMRMGSVVETPRVSVAPNGDFEVSVADLTTAWRGTLDW